MIATWPNLVGQYIFFYTKCGVQRISLRMEMISTESEYARNNGIGNPVTLYFPFRVDGSSLFFSLLFSFERGMKSKSIKIRGGNWVRTDQI